jgi:DNA integrity scanning protein DisA with diadenylate cyclase activity
MLRRICGAERNCDPEVLETVLEIAVRLARQRGKQSRLGALFVVGDEARVLKRSKPLILDPLENYSKEAKDIRDANVQGTLKELARMDGAFIISGDGYALSAARYIETVARFVDLPLGLGTRHMAAASISKETNAVAVVVSESDGVVRVFDDGELVAEIIPRIGDLELIKPCIKGDYEKLVEKNSNLTIIVKRT